MKGGKKHIIRCLALLKKVSSRDEVCTALHIFTVAFASSQSFSSGCSTVPTLGFAFVLHLFERIVDRMGKCEESVRERKEKGK